MRAEARRRVAMPRGAGSECAWRPRAADCACGPLRAPCLSKVHYRDAFWARSSPSASPPESGAPGCHRATSRTEMCHAVRGYAVYRTRMCRVYVVCCDVVTCVSCRRAAHGARSSSPRLLELKISVESCRDCAGTWFVRWYIDHRRSPLPFIGCSVLLDITSHAKLRAGALGFASHSALARLWLWLMVMELYSRP